MSFNTSKKVKPCSFQLYCCSFISCDDTSNAFTILHTVTNIRPKQLTTPKYLIKSSFKQAKCQELYDLIFNSPKKIINKGFNGIDARMVLVINYENKVSDTISYFEKNMLCPNDSEVFKYDFNILKPLRHSLNIKECFDCLQSLN